MKFRMNIYIEQEKSISGSVLVATALLAAVFALIYFCARPDHITGLISRIAALWSHML